MEEHIFAPLGMSNSTAGPADPMPDDAIGYRYRERITAEPRVYEHIGPAGAIRTTAGDFSRLMGALLNDGAWQGSRILDAESVRELFATHFRPNPMTPGYALALHEVPHPRDRVLAIGGELPGFSARMLLLPERRIGLFVAVNRKDPLLALELFDTVLATLDARGGEDAPLSSYSPRSDEAVPRLADFEGTYRLELTDGTWLEVANLFAPAAHVVAEDAGLKVSFSNMDLPVEHWRRVAPRVFSPVGGPPAAFELGEVPRLYMFHPVSGPVTLDRVSFWRSSSVALAGFLVCVAILVFGLAAVTVDWLRRLRRRSRADTVLVRSRRLVGSIALMNLVFLAGFVTALVRLAILYDDRFAFGIPAWVSVVLILPYVSALLTAAFIASVLGLWRRRRGGPVLRALLSVFALTSITFLALVWQWHLYAGAW